MAGREHVRRTGRPAPLPGRPGAKPARALVAAALAAGAPVAAWPLCRTPLSDLRAQLTAEHTRTALPLDLLLSTMACGLLGAVCLWLAAVTLCTAVEAATGWSSTLARRLTPALVHRAVLTACGAALGTGSVAAPATAVPADQSPLPVAAPVAGAPGGRAAPPSTPAVDLTGLRLPDRAVGEVPRRRPPRPERPATHRVVRGECLWSVAADLLPAGAGAERVAAAWRVIYRGNRAVIGPDPDLLLPGTVLRLPDPLRPSTRRGSSPFHSDEPSASTDQKGDDS